MNRKLLAAALAVGFLLIGSQFALAQDHAGPVVTVYPYFPTYTVDQIPYFAQNPPVYYSYPVKRPYGLSPYPFPGTVGYGMKAEPAPAEKPAPAPARTIRPPRQFDEDRLVSHHEGYTTIAYTSSSGRRVKTIIFE